MHLIEDHSQLEPESQPDNSRQTWDAFVAGLDVSGEVDGARPHLSQVSVWNDQVAGVAAGAAGRQVGQHVDRAADGAVAAAGAAAGPHAAVASRRDDHHLV